MRRSFLIVIAALAVAASAAAAPPRAHVAVRATTLGSALVDSRGHTLYMYDRGSCSGACLQSWPMFLTSGKPLALKGVPAAKLGTVKVAGKLQVTFAGHRLYFFAGDRKAGDVKGAAIAHWAALSAAGAKLRAAGPVAPPISTVPDPGGGGYGGGDGY